MLVLMLLDVHLNLGSNQLIAGALSMAVTESVPQSMKRKPVSSPLFTGRQNVLEHLESYFSARGTGCHQRREFLLYGVGGAGKTQLALKFAEIYQNR